MVIVERVGVNIVKKSVEKDGKFTKHWKIIIYNSIFNLLDKNTPDKVFSLSEERSNKEPDIANSYIKLNMKEFNIYTPCCFMLIYVLNCKKRKQKRSKVSSKAFQLV